MCDRPYFIGPFQLPPRSNNHNKKSTTYESKRSKRSKQLDQQRTLFDMFRKENVLASSRVNNDKDQQVTNNKIEMQIDTPSENMTDVSDESEESTHYFDDSSIDSEKDDLEIQDETVTIENNNQERKSVDGRSFLKTMQSQSYIEKLGIQSHSFGPKKRGGYVKYILNKKKVNIGVRRP